MPDATKPPEGDDPKPNAGEPFLKPTGPEISKATGEFDKINKRIADAISLPEMPSVDMEALFANSPEARTARSAEDMAYFLENMQGQLVEVKRAEQETKDAVEALRKAQPSKRWVWAATILAALTLLAASATLAVMLMSNSSAGEVTTTTHQPTIDTQAPNE
jgi:hypothetical protein